MIYFLLPNKSLLRLTATSFDMKAIVKAATNGSSEFMTNIAMSIVGMLYNVQLLHYAGENGVSAYGVLMYVSMIFSGAFIGYSVGIAPVVGYHNGAKNREELHGLLKKSLILIGLCSVLMVGLSEAMAYPLSRLFVGYDKELFDMTLSAFRIYSFSFLFMGYAIFASGFFTALNDGVTSAVISFLRTLVFQIAAVLILPLIWELDGIWYSIIVAEVMAVALSAVFLAIKRKKYGY
jgi:Na+-driven multidrug efflux pump